MIELWSQEWFKGFVSGVAATLLGFGFTVAWDLYKSRRERIAKQAQAVTAIHEEIAGNLVLLAGNRAILNQNLQRIANAGHEIRPLAPLQCTAWHDFRSELPDKALESETLQTELRGAYFRALHCNEMARNRDLFLLHGNAGVSYLGTLEQYDRMLASQIDTLSDSYKAILPRLT